MHSQQGACSFPYLGYSVMLLQGCQVTRGVYPAVARRRVRGARD